MQTKNIKQSIILPCTPQQAYDAWLDSKTHGEMIGAKAIIAPTIGGTFDIWDDYLIGKTIEIDKEKRKIVQKWRDNSTDWPKDYYSTITIEFLPHQDKQTKLVFQQTGIPEKHLDSIAKGWEDYYWKPMKNYFKR